MIPIASLLVTLLLGLLVTRVASMALMLTGMSRESAKFQAFSAFTGVGFTTAEAENVVRHPVRRHIVMSLMMIGNLGVATVVATVMLSMMDATRSQTPWQGIALLAAGLFGLWLAATSRFIERHLNRIISFALTRLAKLQVRDYVAMLQLEEGYGVSELAVERNDWLAEKTLKELKLPQEGVLVLAIRREGGRYLGTPTADMMIHATDTLILYGPVERIEELDRRRRGRKGDVAHEEAVHELEEALEEQEVGDHPEK